MSPLNVKYIYACIFRYSYANDVLRTQELIIQDPFFALAI
jgi:hypothetical protein